MRDDYMKTAIRTFVGGLALLATQAMTPASAQDVAVGVSAAPTSVDPHYHNLTPNNALATHIFGTLVSRDAQSRPVPGLATSWKLIDDNTWEFKLRPGVTFHNGAPFTAEDVAYSLARPPLVLNSPGSFAVYSRSVKEVQVVDAITVRLKTDGLYPLLPVDLTNVRMVWHGIGPGATTEDFNSGKHAIGTGPFKLAAYRSGDRVELTRNESYWGTKPHWKNVSYRFLPNNGARVAALLAGDVSLIEAVPTTEVAQLSTNPKLVISEVNSTRIVFLWFDRSRTGPTPFVKGPNGETLDKNPLNDLRVRQALSIAINRPAIVERVMENAAIASGQLLPPGSYSHVPGLNPPTFDPQKAKALLAEAGYQNGLSLTLHGPNDRYVNDAKIIQAVGQMWTRIGVKTQVEGITWPSFIGRASKQEFSTFLLAWGTTSGEASNPLRALIATPTPAKGWGTANRGKYSNPTVDNLLERALATAGDAAREKLLIEATSIAMTDLPFIPLHTQKNIWAMRAGLTYVPRVDEETNVAELRPARQ